MTLEDPSLSAHGYQLLPLATSHFVGNNKEFRCFRHILRSLFVERAYNH